MKGKPHKKRQKATNAEMITNFKTANVLGLIVPLSLLGRADDAIE